MHDNDCKKSTNQSNSTQSKRTFFCWFLDFMFSGWYVLNYLHRQSVAKVCKIAPDVNFHEFMSDFKI